MQTTITTNFFVQLDSTMARTAGEYVEQIIDTDAMAADFDIEQIVADFDAAISECMPEGWHFVGATIYADEDSAADLDSVLDEVRGIDFWAIVSRNEH